MSEVDENNSNEEPINKRKKRKKKKKIDLNENEEQEEENNNTTKKLKKRSKTTKKSKKNLDEINEEDDIEIKPKRKKRRKRKNIQEEEENNEENEEKEQEEKSKKRKKRRKKRPHSDDENENIDEPNNEDENEEGKKKRRKKKKKKKIENEEENEKEDNNEDNENEDNNEENENEESPKKKKKKKKKKLIEDGGLFTNDMKQEFYKTAKKLIKKKKKKKKEENEENEEDLKNKTLPNFSNKLKTKKKKENNIIIKTIKEEQKNEKEESEDNDNDDLSEEEDVIDLQNSEIKWPSIKKEFLTTIENYINEISLYEHIDMAIVSTIYLSKKEYGKFKLTKHHEVYPIKNYNNINWVKEPYRKIQDKFYELIAPGQLLSNNYKVDFSNRICNEYEIYTAKAQLIKISGNDITKPSEPSNFFFLSEDEKNTIRKPYLFFFFTFNDEKSIMFYREALEYLKQNKNDLIFIPVYAPLIQVQKNINYVTEMLYKYNVYKKGDEYEIYFCSNDALNKRFRYISEDNKKTIKPKTVYIEVISDKFVVRAIRDLDSFTFNLIDENYQVNKEKHQKIKKNMEIFKKKSKAELKNISLREPFNCNLFLRKVKIYTFPIKEKKLKLRYTLYDPLSGKINCHNVYKSEDNYNEVCEIFKDLGNYKLRSNPKKFTLTYSQKNQLIIEEMNKCLKANEKLNNVVYQSIFQTQKIIMSLGPQFKKKLKFEPIKKKSFKLEVHIDYNLFNDLKPMNIIGSLYGLTLFSYFNNCDYIACLPKIGETFPNKLILTDSKTLKNEEVSLNQSLDKPSLLIIFSLSFQNYFASSELSSRFKLIKKLENFIKKDNINVILIYRGEPAKFSQRFEEIKDESIFCYDFPLYIQSSADLKFPLIYQNNDIESTDSQIMTYILNKNNKLVYTGNLEDIELDKTFQNLCTENNNDNENILVYKEHANLSYNEFKIMIKPIIKKLEKIIELEIKKEKNTLLYRPFFSLSYNTYTNFENDSTDNEKYINHIRLRILVKEPHFSFTQNKEFKKLISELKTYGASTIIMIIDCEEFEFEKQCSNCHKDIDEISENKPIYFDKESDKIFCEKCGEKFSNDIKNDTFVTFFNTNTYNNEVISEMYENYNKRNVNINPVLGSICKICQNKMGDVYYLNLTNFNIDYIESPLTPIDICENCFENMKKGEPFLNEPLKRLNYEKFGLDYKQMIYRKIYIPLTGQ